MTAEAVWDLQIQTDRMLMENQPESLIVDKESDSESEECC